MDLQNYTVVLQKRDKNLICPALIQAIDHIAWLNRLNLRYKCCMVGGDLIHFNPSASLTDIILGPDQYRFLLWRFLAEKKNIK